MAILSVVIPSYNVEKFIGETLQCIVDQTFEDWELLVVDDGSTDGTVDVISEFAQKDARIRLIGRPRGPKGAQTCRNTGIETAAGKYLIIFDSDDVIAPCCFEQRVKYMETHDADYATFRGQAFTTDGKGNRRYTHKWGEPKKKDALEGFLSADYPFGIWNNIYRANVCKEVLFDEKLAIYQDFDFAVQTILKGYKHAYAEDSQPDYFYRQGHGGAITSKFITDEKYESTKYLFGKTLKAIEPTERFEKYRRTFFKFFLTQYERVLINGNDEQKEDFYAFIGKNYGTYARRRLRILRSMGRSTADKKRIVLTGWMLFEPRMLLRWVGERFARR